MQESMFEVYWGNEIPTVKQKLLQIEDLGIGLTPQYPKKLEMLKILIKNSGKGLKTQNNKLNKEKGH